MDTTTPRALFVGVADAERYVSVLDERVRADVASTPDDAAAADEVDVLVVGGRAGDPHRRVLERVRERHPDVRAVAVDCPASADATGFDERFVDPAPPALAACIERLGAQRRYAAAVERFYERARERARNEEIAWADEELSTARRAADEALETVDWHALLEDLSVGETEHDPAGK